MDSPSPRDERAAAVGSSGDPCAVSVGLKNIIALIPVGLVRCMSASSTVFLNPFNCFSARVDDWLMRFPIQAFSWRRKSYLVVAYGLGEGPHGAKFTCSGATSERPTAINAMVTNRRLIPVEWEKLFMLTSPWFIAWRGPETVSLISSVSAFVDGGAVSHMTRRAAPFHPIVGDRDENIEFPESRGTWMRRKSWMQA